MRNIGETLPFMAKRLRAIAALIALVTLIGWGVPAQADSFSFRRVVARAQALALQRYKPPHSIPAFLAHLDYDEYQKIRFHPRMQLWRESHSHFQVMLMSPGEVYRHTVRIHVVAADGTHTIQFRKSDFHWPSRRLAQRIPSSLGYAGFKLTYPLNHPGVQSQFLVFAGASYFRGVGRGERFGLSGRGIAVDTGLPRGEQFPAFTDFWLVRPSPDAHVLKFYALLDGRSLTGAYRFTVFPGLTTRVEVRAILFIRKDVALLGLAPLTSMFYYGTNTPRPIGQWRPQVHDSGGLLVHLGTGEWLWRPLANPLSLHMDYFIANSPRGFGLLQRDSRFGDYEDAEARYDLRPSAWVAPRQAWGDGHVVLVEIPTDAESNDNIVAFWSPDAKAVRGKRYDLAYTIGFGPPSIPDEPMGQAQATFVGTAQPAAGSGGGATYRFVVDFSGGELGSVSPSAHVTAVVTGLQHTTILQQSVRWLPPLHCWRLSLLARPRSGEALQLRAYLKAGDKTLSETWTYELPARNRLNRSS